MREYLDLFLTWFKIGGFTYGGGMAMLPMIQAEIVDKKKWASEEEIIEWYAISQCTPGIIAVNIATFVGYKQKGTLGGIVATLGCVTPSIILISIIATFLNNIADIPVVKHALNGVSIAVCVLMSKSVYSLLKSSIKDIYCVFITVAAFVCSYYLSISSVIIVFVAALIGIGLGKAKQTRGNE